MSEREKVVNVYELIIFNPLMARETKCSFTISQTNLLLMCLLLENGLVPTKEGTEQLGKLLNSEVSEKLLLVIAEMLKKAGSGLQEYYEKIKELSKTMPMTK